MLPSGTMELLGSSYHRIHMAWSAFSDPLKLELCPALLGSNAMHALGQLQRKTKGRGRAKEEAVPHGPSLWLQILLQRR